MKTLYNKVLQLFRHRYWKSKRIVIEKSVFIGRFNDFDGGSTGDLVVSKGCWIGELVKLFSCDGFIRISDNTFIGHYTIIYGHEGSNNRTKCYDCSTLRYCFNKS